MIYLGIDDTDMPGTPGTNQFCKMFAKRIEARFRCRLIVRHQLLYDERIPYTSKNSSASMHLEPCGIASADPTSTLKVLIAELRAFVSERFLVGSDPGFAVATKISMDVRQFGKTCQQEVVSQHVARKLACDHLIHLEGCGGTNDGVIGALAAVGLAATGDDGRIVQLADWPDDLCGSQSIATLAARGVTVVSEVSGQAVRTGSIDVGKHLRPNYRNDQAILFAARRKTSSWQAIRLP